jgi:bacteriocin-like protein
MELQELSEHELRAVEGGLYNNNSPFSTKSAVVDGILIGIAAGSAFGAGGAFLGGLIGGLLGLLF